jgi:hypothetical protein
MLVNGSMVKCAFLVAVVVLVAGCGSNSSSKSTTTTASAASQRTAWANSVCAPLVTWKSTVKSIATQLGSQPSKSAISSSAKQAETATVTLMDSLKAVGKPPTPAADEAKSTVAQLRTDLSDAADQVKSATENVSGVQGTAAAASAVAATAKTLKSQVSSAAAKLKSLGPNGEWKQAFSEAESCKTLQSS